jgi:hypothetical protein
VNILPFREVYGLASPLGFEFWDRCDEFVVKGHLVVGSGFLLGHVDPSVVVPSPIQNSIACMGQRRGVRIWRSVAGYVTSADAVTAALGAMVSPKGQ